MPKAKPVSLHPLSFEEAIKAIMRVDLQRVSIEKKQKLKSKRKKS